MQKFTDTPILEINGNPNIVVHHLSDYHFSENMDAIRLQAVTDVTLRQLEYLRSNNIKAVLTEEWPSTLLPGDALRELFSQQILQELQKDPGKAYAKYGAALVYMAENPDVRIYSSISALEAEEVARELSGKKEPVDHPVHKRREDIGKASLYNAIRREEALARERGNSDQVRIGFIYGMAHSPLRFYDPKVGNTVITYLPAFRSPASTPSELPFIAPP